MATNTLRQVARKLDVGEVYVRHMLKSGRLEATKDERGNWVITDEAIAKFEATPKNQRAGGIQKLVVPATPEVLEALKMVGVEGKPIVHNYNPEKSKAYRIKRALAKKMDADIDRR